LAGSGQLEVSTCAFIGTWLLIQSQDSPSADQDRQSTKPSKAAITLTK
jgi:hypothetical protein